MQQELSIDISVLPSVRLSERSKLPAVSAVYFAISASDEVLYIGKANNLSCRWYGHHRYDQLCKFRDVRLAWLEMSQDELDVMEQSLILHFDPPLNNTRLLETSYRPTVQSKHCSDCRHLGQIGGWEFFYCTAHEQPRIYLERGDERIIKCETSLLLGRKYELAFSIAELPSADEVEPEELKYEDFHEPA